jgi:hypothetical protein
MHEQNATQPQAIPLPPYRVMTASYAICYFVLAFAVEWLWDKFAGDPFDAGATASKAAVIAVFFGLTMAWLVPRLRRRR